MIHECLFCGVKFSSSKTLQAHLTNYCSKKPILDVGNSNLFLHFMLMQDQLKYKYFSNQQLNSHKEASSNSEGEWFEILNEKFLLTHAFNIFKCTKFSFYFFQITQKKFFQFFQGVENTIVEVKSEMEKRDLPLSKQLPCVSKNQDVQEKENFIKNLSPKNEKLSNSQVSSQSSKESELFSNNFNYPFSFLPFFPLNYPPSLMSDALKQPLSYNKKNELFDKNENNQKKTKKDQFLQPFESPIDLSGKKNEAYNLTSDHENSKKLGLNGYQYSLYENYKETFMKNIAQSSNDKNDSFVLAKQSYPPLTRCVECNIVFFKAENYLAHKQHYCASRNSNLSETPPLKGSTKIYQNNSSKEYSKPLADTDLDALMTNADKTLFNQEKVESTCNELNGRKSPDAKEIDMLKQNFLQYYCIPCKIKFSSMETLKAHKKYYCSSRNNVSENSDSKENQVKKEPKSKDVNTTNTNIKEETFIKNSEKLEASITCPLCLGVFHSEQAMPLHLCTPSSSKPLFQCFYCDHLSQGEDRLLEHLRTHAPSKVYRCLLCGYRGNTVRGMRMHGKMHNDAGESFTDETMVEIEEPPSFPKKFKMPSSFTPFALPSKQNNSLLKQHYLLQTAYELPEIELIRMKNEPYKRRRSRKAYEKSEFKAKKSLDDIFTCFKCSAVFSNDSHLQIHMLSHMSSPISPIKTSPQSKFSLAIKKEFQNEETCSKNIHSNVHSDVNNNQISPPIKKCKLSPSENNSNSSLKNRKVNESYLKQFGGSPSMNSPPTNTNATFNTIKTTEKIQSKEENLVCKIDPFQSGLQDFSKYCKQCNINFMYTSTYQAHKKYYCSSRDHEDEEEDEETKN